jgi:hypothetical protein
MEKISDRWGEPGSGVSRLLAGGTTGGGTPKPEPKTGGGASGVWTEVGQGVNELGDEPGGTCDMHTDSRYLTGRSAGIRCMFGSFQGVEHAKAMTAGHCGGCLGRVAGYHPLPGSLSGKSCA